MPNKKELQATALIHFLSPNMKADETSSSLVQLAVWKNNSLERSQNGTQIFTASPKFTLE